MWRSVMQRTVDPLLLRITKRMESLIEAENVRHAGHSAILDPTVKIYPSAQIKNFLGDPKAITVGPNSNIYGQLLVLWDGGRIDIGEWSALGEGSRIVSQVSISIGNHVLISHFVDIHDTNGHPIDLEERTQDIQAVMTGAIENRLPEKTASKPIIIEDDVWIDFKATVLKGVHIGRGAIVMEGSLVVEDVPAWTIVAGNPAKVVRELTAEERI